MSSPVYLPHLATVTSFRLFYGDFLTLQDSHIHAHLRKRGRNSLFPIEMSFIEVEGDHYDGGNILEQEDTSIINGTVAGSDDLWIWVRFEVNATGSYLRFYGCQVEYAVSTVQ